MGPDGNEKVLPNIVLTGENGTIKFATNSTTIPFSYIRNNQKVGYDIEIVIRICEKLGYKIEITDMDFAGLIPGITTGKYDMAGSCITITEERKKSVLFSEPNYQGGLVVVIKKTADTEKIVDFNYKKVGCLNGTIFDNELLKKYPKAIPQYYNTIADCLAALKAGKIEAYIDDQPSAKYMMNTVGNINYLPELLLENEYAFVFNKKNGELEKKISSLIKEYEHKGILKELEDKWFGLDESKKVMPEIELTDENGTIELAANFTLMPFVYMKNNVYAGYDIELMMMICKELGYGLNIHNVELAGLLPGVVTGKFDVGVGCITITEDIKENVLFSYTNFSGGIVFVVNEENEDVPVAGFLDNIKKSFINTFITEDRYQLILKGLGVTIIISLGAAILGTILGFGVCVARRSPLKVFNIPAKIFIRIIQGTPIVLILMILFYIVFGSLNGIYVAILGFAINFAAYTAEMMRTGIDAIDKGQREAALSLGFKPFRIFKEIIFPQAARHVIPVYKGEFISMVKMTSVVGYIAIEDLTRASDLIRTNTYEAFFPLISTAVIYFLITYLVTILLTMVEIRIDPKSRKRSIRGVNKI